MRSNARGDAYSKMNRRKGIIAVIVATVGLGVAALPARAELHSVTVVLITGERITRTVDVPPGTPVSSISIPGITGTISQIIDNGVIAMPTPQATPQLPVPTVPAVPGVTAPKPTRDAEARQRQQARPASLRPNQSTGQAPNATTAPAGNQKFRAGNLNTKKLKSQLEREAKKKARATPPGRALDGTPTTANPTFSLAMPGAAPIGVPNFFIDKFRIPPFLLPLYQAAGIEYGVRWEVLAAINEIETDYGRNLNVSSAGALGWMQFMPTTWKQYGVDANKDDLKDPYNPADAIFAAARYLKAAGAEQDLRKAIFAYNHADWYVDSVLMRARLIGGLPSNLVGSLTGLTQGHFPVAAKATYADDLSEAEAKKLGKRSRKAGNRALVVEGSKHRRGIKVFARRGAPVVAVNDGRIVRVGTSKRLGHFVQLQDTYGNTYTYARLAKVAKSYPAPRQRTTTAKQVAKELALPAKDAAPTAPASVDHREGDEAREDRQGQHARGARQDGRQARPAGAVDRQAAPVRQPAAPQRRARRRPAAGVRAHRQDRRLVELQELLLQGLRPRPQGRPHQAPAPGLARRRRHDPRPHRQDLEHAGAARAVRDPPRRPRRPAHRSEADPRRLEAARVDRDLPRGGQEPVLRPRRQAAHDRPDPADEQGGARPARARQPAHRALLLRARRHPHRPGRPPRAGDARVPRRLGHAPDRDVAAAAATGS